MNGASVFGEETAFIGVGLENNWGRSNGMIGTYPIGGPRWPILGVSPTSFVRPTPKQRETYPAGYIREPRSGRNQQRLFLGLMRCVTVSAPHAHTRAKWRVCFR